MIQEASPLSLTFMFSFIHNHEPNYRRKQIQIVTYNVSLLYYQNGMLFLYAWIRMHVVVNLSANGLWCWWRTSASSLALSRLQDYETLQGALKTQQGALSQAHSQVRLPHLTFLIKDIPLISLLAFIPCRKKMGTSSNEIHHIICTYDFHSILLENSDTFLFQKAKESREFLHSFIQEWKLYKGHDED